MNIGNLLGSVLQSGVSRSTTSRIQSSLGGGSTSGAPGGNLGSLLNEVGKMVGGNQNLAVGGLGALAGAIIGGRKGVGGVLKGTIGGGAMALLGMMAYQALKKSGTLSKLKVPLGLAEPKTAAETAELEQSQELVLKAMINAAKADGQIEESEITRIVGKVQEQGADQDSQAFLKAEMAKPMDIDPLVAAARGRPELAAEIYAASLLAIEIDTPAEKEYLATLADSLGIAPAVVQNLHQAVGLKMG